MKQYQVILWLEVEDDSNPSKWDWSEMIGLYPNESFTIEIEENK